MSLVYLIKPSTPGIETQEPIMQLAYLHSPLESCQQQPTGVHQPQPAGVHQPQPQAVNELQPADIHQPQPAGVNQPHPAGIHQSMLVSNRNPLRITEDGTLIIHTCIYIYTCTHTYME